jgi:serine phosphatase RsbU (regulator of sigma subunit)/DNA-binding NarL/FixJ family response regulator
MMQSKPIRVFLVDDHAMLRSGLAGFLRSFDDLELAGEAASGEEAVRLCERIQPDVVLMDLVMPGMDGAAATRLIRQRCPQVQIIALTSFKDQELVQRALEAGAIGYLLKNISVEELADAIRAAHAGRPTLAPEVAQTLIQAEQLERLARAILDAAPDISTLAALLRENAAAMLPGCQIEIRIFPDQIVLHHPEDWPPAPDSVWEWLRSTSKAHSFLPGSALAWADNQPTGNGLVVAPILGVENQQPVGGVYVAQRGGQDPDSVADMLPIVKALAAQISSVLHSAEVHARTQADQRLARELSLAGQIQASFLPGDVPEMPGWQLAAILEPARVTSGDFYDIIALPGGRWGLAIADVADKGIGAALVMALSCSLIRTYAAEYDTRPDLVLSAVNRRILSDTRAGLFVTIFYGVLDPASGTLTYCNAGHNPPYLLSAHSRETVSALRRTGMALGIGGHESWESATVQLAPGDMLLLYTDGVTEAQNVQGAFFGKERLIAAAQVELGKTAQAVLDALVATVQRFIDGAPLADRDDIAWVVVVRDT